MILVSPSEVTEVLKYRNYIDYESVIPLTPDTYSFVLKTGKFDKNKIINLCDINFEDLQNKISTNLVNSDVEILSKIADEESISQAIRQNLTSELYCVFGCLEYLYSIFEEHNKFSFFQQGFHETKDLDFLVSSVLEKLINTSQGIFSLASFKNLSEKDSVISSLNNTFVKKLLKKKNFYISSGQFYRIPEISKSIKRSKDLLEVQISIQERKNLFLDLLQIFRNIFNFYLKGRLTFYYPSSNKNPLLEEHFQKIKTIILDSPLKRASQQLPVISGLIKNQLNFSLGCEDFVAKIFEQTHPLFFLSHQIRWMMMPELAQFLKSKKIPIHLISHGSHSPSDDDYSYNAQKFLANGLLFSNFSTYSYCQSPFALEALNQFTSKKEARKIFPLMWGNDYSKVKVKKIKKKNPDLFKIIYAGTFKPYCLRPAIYETSFELIKSLRILIDTVDQVEDVRLTIRMREEDECSLDTLKSLLPSSENIVFDNSGTFEEKLTRHDCLMSFSSTTLEEALSYSIPVATFTCDSTYRHLKQTSSSGLVYNLTKENLKEQLISMKESIESRFESGSEDNSKILWVDGQALNFFDFLP